MARFNYGHKNPHLKETVIKVMPPLVIEDDLLEEGLQVLTQSVGAVSAARERHLRIARRP